MKIKNIVGIFISVVVLAVIVGGCVKANMLQYEDIPSNIYEEDIKTDNSMEKIAGQIGKSVTITSENGSLCTLELGMDAAEAINRMQAAGVKYKGGDILNGGSENQCYSINYNVWFSQQEQEKGNTNWIVDTICIKTPLVATEKSLRTGDLEETIEKLYGKCENIVIDKEEGHRYYIYQQEGYCLRIAAGGWVEEEQTVFDWMLVLTE